MYHRTLQYVPSKNLLNRYLLHALDRQSFRVTRVEISLFPGTMRAISASICAIYKLVGDDANMGLM